MQYRLFLSALFVNLLFIQSPRAAATDWEIVPTTCLVERLGSACHLQLQIKPPAPRLEGSLSNNPPQQVCFNLDEEQLHCRLLDIEVIAFDIQFDRQRTLSVWLDGIQVYSTTLRIQSTSPIVKRRRVRSPWSLF